MNLSYKKPVDQQLVDKLINYIQSNSKKSTKVIIDINGTINSAVAGVLFKKALAEKLIAIIFDFNTPSLLISHQCHLLIFSASYPKYTFLAL